MKKKLKGHFLSFHYSQTHSKGGYSSNAWKKSGGQQVPLEEVAEFLPTWSKLPSVEVERKFLGSDFTCFHRGDTETHNKVLLMEEIEEIEPCKVQLIYDQP
ncbi:hypothetical protein L1049_011258 [Liquidambar formosana]|uniref:Uncharacterized protein n=1 Tax=Liquidambar formosana TaxID=63359 RepID=A0AAP0X2M0_LIQFO